MKKVIRVKHGKKVHNSSALDCIDNIFFWYTLQYIFSTDISIFQNCMYKKVGRNVSSINFNYT